MEFFFGVLGGVLQLPNRAPHRALHSTSQSTPPRAHSMYILILIIILIIKNELFFITKKLSTNSLTVSQDISYLPSSGLRVTNPSSSTLAIKSRTCSCELPSPVLSA